MSGEGPATGHEGNSREIDPDLPSCDSCRKRKLKCSRESPACTSCKRLDLRCTYEYQRKKPGLKSGAVDALARRIELIESRLDDGISCQGNHQSSTSGSPPPQERSRNDHSSQEAIGPAVLMLIQELQNLTSSLNQRPVPSSAITGPPTELNGSSSRKRARIDDQTEVNQPHPQTTHEPPLNDQGPTPSSSYLLRDESFLKALLNVYYSNIHPWIPILQEDQTRIRMLDAQQHHQNLIILHAIFFAACRFVPDESLPVQNLTQLAKSSRDYVMLHAMNDLTLENLQALIIIVFIDLGDGETSKAWSLIGSLTRTVQYLHLSVEDADADERSALLSGLPKLPNTDDWIESEARRRVFWCIFLLDRFCSITTGWNVSLTADNVCRRLPADGGVWRKKVPALTPYFGIWDNKAAKIGNTITFLPSKYDTPWQISDRGSLDGSEATGPSPGNASGPAEPLKVGAFSYCIESVESLSRINTHFLQQKINFLDREEVSSWFTRFKELDLRLVHWKMFLPQKYKDPNNTPNPITWAAMDPNMTLAHVVHNVSSILLHQRIAYPPDNIKHLRLPSSFSADTCYIAATETCNITVKYLKQAIVTHAMAPLFSMCVFTSAKILLVHSRYCKEPLAPEFWTLIECLETMGRTWKGRLATMDHPPRTLAQTLALQLRELYDDYYGGGERSGDPVALFIQPVSQLGQPSIDSIRQARQSSIQSPHAAMVATPREGATSTRYSQAHTVPAGVESENHTDRNAEDVASVRPPNMIPANTDPQAVPNGIPHQAMGLTMDDISAGLMDQSFLHTDRVINYDDFVFNTDPWGSGGIPDL